MSINTYAFACDHLSKRSGMAWGISMSLEPCRECRELVSTEARACPKCGINRPIKITPRWLKLLLALFVIAAIVGALSPDPPNIPHNYHDDYAECLIEHIREEPSVWNGNYGAFSEYFNKKCEDERNAYLRFDTKCKQDIDKCLSESSLLPVITMGIIYGKNQ